MWIVEYQAGLSSLNKWAAERPWDTSGNALCLKEVSAVQANGVTVGFVSVFSVLD